MKCKCGYEKGMNEDEYYFAIITLLCVFSMYLVWLLCLPIALSFDTLERWIYAFKFITALSVVIILIGVIQALFV